MSPSRPSAPPSARPSAKTSSTLSKEVSSGISSIEPLAREKLSCRRLDRQPVGWVRVFHSFPISKSLILELWYTPDQHVLDRASASAWLAHYRVWQDSLESLAIQLMDDFRNEVVPCWIKLRLQDGKDFVVEAEDRQPNWRPNRGSRFPDSI